MPEWQLSFPIATLDDRITMRAAVARLREDPHHVRTVLEERRERDWVYRIEFEGEPDNQEILRLREVYRHYVYVTPDFGAWGRAVNPRPNQNGDSIDPEVARRILENYLATIPERRRIVPPNPLRPRIDYQAVVRRTFIVEELPQGALPFYEGALPVYDRDPDPGTIPRQITFGANPAPFTPPDWLRPNTWLRNKTNNNLIYIRYLLPNHQVAVEHWCGQPEPERTEVTAEMLAQHWEPCAEPMKSKSRFDL